MEKIYCTQTNDMLARVLIYNKKYILDSCIEKILREPQY